MLIRRIKSAVKSAVKNAIYKTRNVKTIVSNLLCIAAVFLIVGVLFAQNSQTTENKADSSLKSAARINPSTLAMEFSLPLGNYPGRNGNSIPVALNYSSKLWTARYTGLQDFTTAINHSIYDYETIIGSNISAQYADKSIAGWTSSLQSPLLLLNDELYNENGQMFQFNTANQSPNVTDGCTIESYEGMRQNAQCATGLSQVYVWSCPRRDHPPERISAEYCIDGGPTFPSIPMGGGSGGNPAPGPTPTPEIMHRVNRVSVQTPDGSSHELRQDDKVYNCHASPQQCSLASRNQGTYLSTDGSAMRLGRSETAGSQTSSKDVLHLPDGGRYIFPSAANQTNGGQSYLEANEYIDKSGNRMTFDPLARKWTDTMGREIADPLMNPLAPQRPAAGIQVYNVKGIDNQNLPYALKWEKLENAFEKASTTLKYAGADTCLSGPDTPVSPSLFENAPPVSDAPPTGDITYIRKQRVCNYNAPLFDPVVMSEITMPDGAKYKFRYNEFGEITKIIYPTGGYERFEYDYIQPLGTVAEYVYSQANRGVKKRFVSAGGEADEQVWEYSVRIGSPNYGHYTVVTKAPDNTRSERDLYWSEDSRFGFDEPRSGMVKEARTYDAGNVLRSRDMTEWIVAPPRTGGDYRAVRDPRPAKNISIAFDPGSGQALATMSETEYDNNSDAEFFAHLNAKKTKSTHFILIDKTLAGAGNKSFSDFEPLFGNAALAGISETDYEYNAAYKAAGTGGLPVRTRVLNPNDPNDILAKTETIYDNILPLPSSNYPYATQTYGINGSMSCPASAGATNCWESQNTNYLGRATTTRVWNGDDNTWIESHTRYDIFGNAVKVKDAAGSEAETVYEHTAAKPYLYAYPTKVISPAPDPTGIHGTNRTSTAETTYDPATGLPLKVKNDFGQETQTEYDVMLRPVRVAPIAPLVAPVSETVYGTPDVNGQLPANQRFVKARKQIDQTNWDEATTWYDGLGRTIKTQSKDSQGDVVVQTKYDTLGRVSMTSNPYRVDGGGNATETIYWSKPKYDELGRVVETFAPSADPLNSPGASLGTTSFSFSTVSNFVGTVITTTDASGRKGRSITNASGQLLRVDEPQNIGGTADADLGTLSNPVQPTFYKYNAQGRMVEVAQGAQRRYFKYDSLGRLIRVRQPEQNVNPSLYLADGNNTPGQWTAGFSYDALGNVKRTTDANGTNIVYEYDKANRVTKRCYTKPNIQTTATQCSQISGADASANTPAVEYFYDGLGLDTPPPVNNNYAKGKLTKVASSVSETRYTKFDYLGRLTESEQRTPFGSALPAATDAKVSKYEYSFSGALVKQTYPSGREVSNAFETDGDLARVYGNANASAPVRTYVNGFSFTASGGISQMRLGNGRWETAKFNERLQVTELGLGNSAADASLWRVGYEYGELASNGTSVIQSKNTGNIARQTIGFAGMANSLVQTYRYDSLYRLTEAKETQSNQQNWSQQFGYDRYGNRTGFNQSIAGIANGQTNQTPPVDPNTNRFTSNNYSYDFNGNITKDMSDASQVRNFTFDGDNKQTEIRDIGGYSIGRYFYDGEGRRVRKVTNLETTIFIYDGLGKIVAEYSTDISQTPQIKYLTEDHLGTPRVITDASGQITARRDFLPFGEDLPAGVGNRTSAQKYGASSDDIRQKFTGYQKDKETSLDFAEARMYENRFGRFTAVDPLLASGKSANPQTFNRYVYVMNNPLAFADPSGLCPTGNCPFDYSGPVYTKQNADGSWRYNDKQEDDSWQRFRGEFTTFMMDCMCDTTFHTNGWYVKAPPTNEYMQNFIGGFNYGADNSITGLKKGGANIGIGFWNTLSNPLGPVGATSGVPNPFYVDSYKYDNLTQAKFGTGTEVGFAVGTVVAGGVFSGGASSLSVVPEEVSVISPQAINGAKLEYLTEGQTAKIQSWVNKRNTDVTLFGSRAKGTANATSDFDYFIEANYKLRNNAKFELPRGPAYSGRNRIDVIQPSGNLDLYRKVMGQQQPYILFRPQ